MDDDTPDFDPTADPEGRLRRRSARRGGSALPLAWLPVLLIIGAVGLLFWWLTQSIQPDRPRTVAGAPTVALGGTPASGGPGTSLPPSAGLPVSEVLRNCQRFLNQSLSVTGRYRARDVQGELKEQPAVTVNDWVLSDGTSAIWVTGRPPGDLSLSGERGVDTPLVVEGILREIGGRLVLDARTVVIAGSAPVTAAGSPSAAEPSTKGIQPGGYVKVVGTGTSQLSFRSGPDRSFGRVAEQPLLPDDTRLKVLEGPRKSDDGGLWWRLQSDKGVIGWALQDYLEATPGP